MKTVVPAPQFVHLTEEEVMDRLDTWEASLDEQEELDLPESTVDPVVAEVERLITGYTDKFDAYCRQHGEIPEEALLYRPASGIERVAFQIFTEALHDSLMEEDDE